MKRVPVVVFCSVADDVPTAAAGAAVRKALGDPAGTGPGQLPATLSVILARAGDVSAVEITAHQVVDLDTAVHLGWVTVGTHDRAYPTDT